MKAIEKEILVEGDIDFGSFFELPATNKLYVTGLNLHEIKNEILPP